MGYLNCLTCDWQVYFAHISPLLQDLWAIRVERPVQIFPQSQGHSRTQGKDRNTCCCLQLVFLVTNWTLLVRYPGFLDTAALEMTPYVQQLSLALYLLQMRAAATLRGIYRSHAEGKSFKKPQTVNTITLPLEIMTPHPVWSPLASKAHHKVWDWFEWVDCPQEIPVRSPNRVWGGVLASRTYCMPACRLHTWSSYIASCCSMCAFLTERSLALSQFSRSNLNLGAIPCG